MSFIFVKNSWNGSVTSIDNFEILSNRIPVSLGGGGGGG